MSDKSETGTHPDADIRPLGAFSPIVHKCCICLTEERELLKKGVCLVKCGVCVNTFMCGECAPKVFKSLGEKCPVCQQRPRIQVQLVGDGALLESVGPRISAEWKIQQKREKDGDPQAMAWLAKQHHFVERNNPRVEGNSPRVQELVARSAELGYGPFALNHASNLMSVFRKSAGAYFSRNHTFTGVPTDKAWEALKYLQNNANPSHAANVITFFSRPLCMPNELPPGMRRLCAIFVFACRAYRIPVPCAYCDSRLVEKHHGGPMPACTTGGCSNYCSKCGVVRYCGRTCQKKHWKGGHRSKCTHHRVRLCDDNREGIVTGMKKKDFSVRLGSGEEVVVSVHRVQLM